MEDKLPIRKEQLYTEHSFIEFCRRSEIEGNKLEKPVTKEFLDACEKDGLLMPLYVEDQTVKKEDGSEQVEKLRYYSPFQIYLAGCLIKNGIDENGLIRGTITDWVYQQQHNTRYIDWNSSGFNVDIYKKNKGKKDASPGSNYFDLVEDFHNFLKLLHALEEDKGYGRFDPGKRRYFTKSPKFQYNLDLIKTEKEKLLEKYNLDVDKLKDVVRSVGYYATHVDPLEYWYHYIKLHDQWRKDLFKGMAIVAQDLYGLCDVILEVIEVVSGEEPPSLMEYVYPDHKPYLMETIRLADGTDFKAISTSHKKICQWVDDNKEILEEVSKLNPAEHLSYEGLKKTLKKVSSDIEEYENLYGDRRYVGSTRIINPEEKVKLEDMDKESQHWIKLHMEQHKSVEVVEGIEKFTSRYGDIESRLKANKITLKQAVEEDAQIEVKYQMTWEIERRLSDLSREVSDTPYKIANAMWPLQYKIEREKETITPEASKAFEKEYGADANSSENRAKFWREYLPKFQKPFVDKLKKIRDLQSELHGIANETRLAYCAVCRSKPVKLHHGHNDKRVSDEVMCDDCFKDMSEKTLGEWKDRHKLKHAEWKCEECGKVFFKFALGNLMNIEASGGANVQLSLKYGRIELQVKCPKCQSKNSRAVDWGWQP